MAENIQQQPATGDDTVTLNFTATINTAKFAARLGIDIPDDSMDATLTGGDEEDEEEPSASETEVVETVTEEVKDSAPAVAEDATISYGKHAQQYANNACQAIAQKCRAQNPMTCRFHGAKIIAADIENQLRAAGVNGAVNVEITNVKKNKAGSEILGINIEVKAKKSETKNVQAAMSQFFKQPGVDGDVNDVDYDSGKIYAGFDIDSLNPGAQAKW